MTLVLPLKLLLLERFKDRGIAGVIDLVKPCRQAFYLHLSGEFPSKKVPGVAVSEEGIPKLIGALVEEIRSWESTYRIYGFRALTTLLSFTRALKSKPIPDTRSITDPPKVESLDLGLWTWKFWKELRLKPSKDPITPRSVRFMNYHMTSKSGPNGQALITSIADLVLIAGDIRLLRAICEVGGKRLSDRIWGLLEHLAFLVRCHPRYKSRRLRKLSYFSDKEGKVRVVAILDYFSQTSLYMFHRWLYRQLKKIPQDCTFDQGRFKETVATWKEFDSVDLSSATDRFPIKYIRGILEPVFPKSFLDAWEYIMVGIPFSITLPNKEENLSYSVGTPMGAYTSWGSFALAHHALVYSCCLELGIKWSEAKYFLLGDDILFGDHRLSELYKIKIKRLGVEFSLPKTYTSTKFFEFAKRIFYEGEEITPFPVSAVVSERRFYQLLPVFYGELNKGWVFGEKVSKAIASYYRHVKGFNAKFCEEIYNKSLVIEELMLTMRGVHSGVDCLRAVLVRLGKPIPPRLNDDVAESVISSCLADLFNESDPFKNKGKGSKDKPLGLLAETITMRLTASESDAIVGWACEHISSVPLLNVYGQISEAYLELKKKADINLARSIKWPLYLKTVGLPLSDGVFVERQRDRLVRATSQIAFKLEKKMAEILPLYEQVIPDDPAKSDVQMSVLSMAVTEEEGSFLNIKLDSTGRPIFNWSQYEEFFKDDQSKK